MHVFKAFTMMQLAYTQKEKSMLKVNGMLCLIVKCNVELPFES